jgi:hydrophobe/amphiphile efflux-3 (HAE3) family protein
MKLVKLSVKYPKSVIILYFIITIFFALLIPGIKTDTDPKHMLPDSSDVRVYNNKVEEEFGLHPDVIVLGIVNEKGVINEVTLSKIQKITEDIMGIEGVITRDVISLSTTDNVISDGGSIKVAPLISEVPKTKEELSRLKDSLLKNRLFTERLLSKDSKATAIYVPIEVNANGKEIADKIKTIYQVQNGDERYYLAGDPVARDTFGDEMFRQMGIFSPIAGMIMFIALWIMFRNIILVAANMGAAMISIIWAMGALIGFGIPVHIMTSMSPVFLMAIATDSVHIFNEFYFRYKETGNKKEAILDTMKAVARPLIYTDLTTVAGFASLATASIVPVKVFGLVVAFGTLIILLTSFTFIPAVLSLLNEKKISIAAGKEEMEGGYFSDLLQTIGSVSIRYNRIIAIFGAVIIIISVWGISMINVNNNMLSWFKPGSMIREADTIMNRQIGGTATAYLVASGSMEDAIKNPELLKFIEGLQKELEKSPVVGKTTSVVDLVKRINRVINNDDPAFETIPDSKEKVGQYLFLFGMSAKPRDLNNFVDYPFRQANIIIQLKTWDAFAMREVLKIAEEYKKMRPELSVTIKPAGIAYFNLIWNDEVLYGMMEGFILSCILVFFLMALSFRSLRLGLISIIPLIFTILVIYGIVGFLGKDFDMPISVLSTLSLGLATDFAVHFIGRFIERYKEDRSVERTLLWTIGRPGKGIIRNAILFALGFTVMMGSTLTPYITVGIFMAAIMLFSALITLIYLPTMMTLWGKWLFKERMVKHEQ